MAKIERIYIEPKAMGKYVTRSLLKYLSNRFGCKIGFEESVEKRVDRKNFRRGAFYIEYDKEVEKEIKGLINLFGLKNVEKEKATGVFDINILIHMQTDMDSGIPVGLGVNEDRVVLIPWPSNVLTRDLTISLYLALLEENVLWIGREFGGWESFFELIDGVPLGMIPEERLVELAEYLAKRTLGEQSKYRILDKLLSEPTEIMGDEELELMDSEDKVVSMLYKWRILGESGKLDKGRYLVDVANLPNVAISTLILLGILAEFDLIIVDKVDFDFSVLNYQGRGSGFVYISDRVDFSKRFDVYIDASRGELAKRLPVGGVRYTFWEKFKPIWEIFKGE
ncbi:MAG: hypothetical protein ACP6IP_04880 [Candidatus Njordarchaeia archaeon]